MSEVLLADGRYSYIHGDHDGLSQAVDTHHVLVRKSSARGFLVYIAILFFLANACSLLLLKVINGLPLLYSLSSPLLHFMILDMYVLGQSFYFLIFLELNRNMLFDCYFILKANLWVRYYSSYFHYRSEIR